MANKMKSLDELEVIKKVDPLVDRDCAYLDGSCKCEYPPTDCKYVKHRIRSGPRSKL